MLLWLWNKYSVIEKESDDFGCDHNSVRKDARSKFRVSLRFVGLDGTYGHVTASGCAK